MNQRIKLGVATSTLAALTSVGCGNQDIVRQYYEMRPAMVRGDWDTAAAQLEKAKETVYGEKDRVMYWLNMGLLLHYGRKAGASNENLVKAEEAMRDLWTTSISGEASKLALNETSSSYQGEDFEQVLLYYFTALNNVELGKLQDAVVEARRADEFLKRLQVYYDKEENGGTIYRQDAFMLWLVGLFYEMSGHDGLNDAFTLYKAAYKAYTEDYQGNFGVGAPAFLGEDLVRTATQLGFTDEAEKFKAATKATGESAKKLGELGELVVLHGNGESPQKRELRFDGQMPDGYVMAIAVPEFYELPPQVVTAEVTVNGQSAQSEVAEPVRAVVLKNFEKRLPGIKLRAIARAAIKYAATKGAAAAAGGSNSTAGALVGFLGNVASVATEAADLRSWTTLPSEIRVARMWLPAGQHQVSVTYRDAAGRQIGNVETFTVDIAAGQRRLISVRSLD